MHTNDVELHSKKTVTQIALIFVDIPTWNKNLQDTYFKAGNGRQ